jgi:hypothetical protein
MGNWEKVLTVEVHQCGGEALPYTSKHRRHGDQYGERRTCEAF